MKELNLPFPGVEFQALLTEIAAQKPDVVFAFFAGGGAVKFVKDYAAAGLPMLPVVRGTAETTRQIFLYTVLLVAVSLVFFAVARMGLSPGGWAKISSKRPSRNTASRCSSVP